MPDLPGPDGALTVAEFKAKHEAVIAKAAAAGEGDAKPDGNGGTRAPAK